MSLSKEEKELAIDLIRLIITVVVPAAIKAIQQFQVSDDMTPEEISALSDKLKNPEEYFS